MTEQVRSTAGRRFGPQDLRLSLRLQVALVIAVLSLVPNLVMALIVILPLYRQNAPVAASLWLQVLVWMLGVMVLSVGIGYLLSHQLLLPLTRLGEQIQALQRSSGRPSAARISMSPGEPQEILSLKRSFNNLFSQVQLEQSRRNSFMATLMHDLKTPLIAGNHLLQVIRDNDGLPREERISLVGQIVTENQNLIDLVQKMVEAHKFEREDVPLKRSQEKLEPILEQVVARVRPLAQERGVSIRLRGDATANVDARELERALYNLLSNAVRYADTQIAVELYMGVIRLSDDGPGLPAPLESLAQPFNAQPVEIAGHRYTAGTGGLGLFIARRIIEAHGGRLVTETTGPGGTVLLIYIGQL